MVPKAGVLAVVAVVTHHKVAVLRHLVGAIIAHRGAVSDKVISQLNGFAVCLGHIDGAVLDLYRFAWQPDNALYIILALIVRVFEDHHIVPLGVVGDIGQSAGHDPVADLYGAEHGAGGHYRIGKHKCFQQQGQDHGNHNGQHKVHNILDRVLFFRLVRVSLGFAAGLALFLRAGAAQRRRFFLCRSGFHLLQQLGGADLRRRLFRAAGVKHHIAAV